MVLFSRGMESITINAEFAARYEKKKRTEELSKRELAPTISDTGNDASLQCVINMATLTAVTLHQRRRMRQQW